MANKKASKKTALKDVERRLRNRSLRSRLHTQLRKLDEAFAGGDKAKAAPVLADTVARLDKSATKGIMHPNKAARKKSRLARRLGKLGA